MRKLTAYLLLSIAPFSWATDHKPADCNLTTINNCIAGTGPAAGNCNVAAVAGDNFFIPSSKGQPTGACIHTAQTAGNSTIPGINFIGAGQGQTIIQMNYTTPFGNWIDMNLAGGTVKFCCMTLTGTVETAIGSDFISIHGGGTVTFEYIDFQNPVSLRPLEIGVADWDIRDVNLNVACPTTTVLISHLTYNQNNHGPAVRVFGCNETWLSAPGLGTTSAFVYVEDSTFTWTASPWNANDDGFDSEAGAKVVFRRNVLYNGFQQVHDNGSSPQLRATRVTEYYDNIFRCQASFGCNTALSLRGGGGGVAFDNFFEVANFTSPNVGDSEIFRDSQAGGAPMTFAGGNGTQTGYHNVCSTIRSTCATSHTPCGGQSTNGSPCAAGEGTGNCNDACTVNADCQNSHGHSNDVCGNIDGGGTNGYIVRDQAGAGTASLTSLAQGSDPHYMFMWFDLLNSNALCTTCFSVSAGDSGVFQSNRDFYTEVSSFTGASGTGHGTLANRPATCTPVVGYYATDLSTLYTCNTANTWTAKYTPAGKHPQADPKSARVTVAAF